MTVLLHLLRAGADALLAPLCRLPALPAVATLALLCGVLLLLGARLLTPQRRLRRIKDLLGAALLELRIFNARPRRVLAAQGRVLLLLGAYLGLSLPALAALGPPMGVLLGRAATRFDWRPLQLGEVALLELELRAGKVAPPELSVEPASAGIAVESPLIFVRSSGRAYLRVRGTAPGQQTVRVRVAGHHSDQRISVATQGPVSRGRATGISTIALVTHEAPLGAASPLAKIEVDYPRRSALLWGLPWWAVFVGGTLLVACGLGRRLGVVF